MFKYFFAREIKNKYLGSSSALFWVLFQPVLILLTYNFVFSYIFKARVPEVEEGNFITYLAVGLWPWMAFSEGLMRSVTAVTERKDLLGKVNFDFKVLVYAAVSGIFTLHVIGYVVVLLVLMAFGKLIPSWELLLLLIPLIGLYILAMTTALLVSAIHVFWRDIQPIMNTLILLLFFSTPIIYSISAIPEKYHHILSINPLLSFFDFIHAASFTYSQIEWSGIILWLVILPVCFVLTRLFFDRLSPEFDDYV
ncbi:ABC transporter permease [Marinicella sp. W31]|uniref:ABC transporter permease n=1 Tax=Marinicella sp. W31 TaxID=3023713 RepID=UPI003757D7B2